MARRSSGLISFAISEPFGGEPYDGDVEIDHAADSDPHLRITVVHTTSEGTVAALRAAASLAKNLCGQIDVQVHEPVPIHFTLQRPHVPASFIEGRLLALMAQAGICTDEVSIHVWFCRSQRPSLADTLAPQSLVVMGGKTRWWNWHDRNLARWLRRQGHQVVLVAAGAKRCPHPRLDRGRLASYIRSEESFGVNL
jgi:hypothetical protein